MVDAERVAALIQRLRGEIAYLDRQAAADRSLLRADEERLSGLKYRFVTALETVVNITQHLCAAQGWGPPTSNADSVVRLAANDVLDHDLATRLARAVGFRNVLVHQYADVDDDLVVANLEHVGDLTAFAASVASWLLDDDGSG